MWLNTPSSMRVAWDSNSFGRLTFPTAYQNSRGTVSQVITVSVDKDIGDYEDPDSPGSYGCPLGTFSSEATTAALAQHSIDTNDFDFVGHYMPRDGIPGCQWGKSITFLSFLLLQSLVLLSQALLQNVLKALIPNHELFPREVY